MKQSLLCIPLVFALVSPGCRTNRDVLAPAASHEATAAVMQAESGPPNELAVRVDAATTENELRVHLGREVMVEGLAREREVSVGGVGLYTAYVDTTGIPVHLGRRFRWSSNAVNKIVRVSGILRQSGLSTIAKPTVGGVYELEEVKWALLQ